VRVENLTIEEVGIIPTGEGRTGLRVSFVTDKGEKVFAYFLSPGLCKKGSSRKAAQKRLDLFCVSYDFAYPSKSALEQIDFLPLIGRSSFAQLR